MAPPPLAMRSLICPSLKLFAAPLDTSFLCNNIYFSCHVFTPRLVYLFDSIVFFRRDLSGERRAARGCVARAHCDRRLSASYSSHCMSARGARAHQYVTSTHTGSLQAQRYTVAPQCPQSCTNKGTCTIINQPCGGHTLTRPWLLIFRVHAARIASSSTSSSSSGV